MAVVALWSMKGGVGVSVLTAALTISADGPAGALMGTVIAVDLVGDLPVVLGREPTEGLGVIDWVKATPDDPVDALRRLAAGAESDELSFGVVPRGGGAIEVDDPDAAAARLVEALGAMADVVFVDCGEFRRPGSTPDDAPPPSDEQRFRIAVAAAADVGWLVSRACYLSARVAAHSPVPADGCVVLSETGRALGSGDVAAAIGAPLVLDVAVDPRIARIVDCGSLLTRLPSSLQRTMVRSLRHVA